MAKAIEPQDLVIHVLNVGFGDNILIEFPAGRDGLRSYGIVDCRDWNKTKGYLDRLMQLRLGEQQLEFVCATHPHADHISGILPLVRDQSYPPREIWESGFRHNSQTYFRILETVDEKRIQLVRLSTGMEWYLGRVRITVLAPAVALRNRFGSYGIDINNASVVLRLEHHDEDVLLTKSQEYKGLAAPEAKRSAGAGVVILAGDAEFDSWAQVAADFPILGTTDPQNPNVNKVVNFLSCAAIKVAHHGSMHSAPLDVYEKMSPQLAIVSTEQEESSRTVGEITLTRPMFPHQASTIALEECGAQVVTTDGSYETQRRPELAHPGTIVLVMPPGGPLRWTKLEDKAGEVPQAVGEV